MNQIERSFNEGCFGFFGSSSNNDSLMNYNQRNESPQPKFGFQLMKALVPKPLADNDPSPDEVISAIASDMSKLSLQEREKAENDVHGIAEGDTETPEFLERCVEEMAQYLQEAKRGTSLELAEAMDRSYTNNFAFRAMFVRAERYRPTEAGDRMIRFFELKKTLFGTELLVKDITLDDLSEDDMEALESGGLQVCPATDSAGRPIIAIMLGLRKYKEAENMQRACFYIYMAVAQNEIAQRRGIVNVSYAVGAPVFKSVQVELRKAVPLHIACQHFAYDDPFAYWSASRGIYLLTKNHKVRFRSHLGTHVECQYALSTFGIPRHALPVNTAGELSTDVHLAWLQKRREMEEMQPIPFRPLGSPAPSSNSSTPAPISASPTPMSSPSNTNGNSNYNNNHIDFNPKQIKDPRTTDILFGRGKSVVEHPGNAWFRELVDKTMLQYESCTRMEKASLAEIIVNMVKDAGGRFLKPEDEGDYWEEVDDHTARKKVAHTFRNRRKFHTGGMPIGGANYI